MEAFDYKEARNKAMQWGLVNSVTWVGSFLLFVYMFPSFLSQLAVFIGMGSIALVGMKIRNYRKENPAMTGLRCWWMTWFTFMCTVLLTTAVQYAYFAWLDGGMLWSKVDAVFSSQEVVDAYTQLGAADSLELMQQMVREMPSLPVKDLVMSLMTSNLFIGFVFSLLSLLFIIGCKPGEKKTEN